MKKKILFLATMLLALGILIPSCKSDDDTPEYEFSISENDKNLTPPTLGENYSINVTSTQNGTRIGFEVVSFPEWAPAKVDLTGLSIEVSESLLREERSGVIIIKQSESGTTIQINIVQDLVEDKVTLDTKFATDTYKLKVISPTINGFSNAPQYKWYEVKTGGDELLAETKDLPFITNVAGKYNLKFHVKDGNVEETLYTEMTVSEPATPYSAKIAKVYGFWPAPGGLVQDYFEKINAATTYEQANKEIESKLASGQTVYLGDFGGYIVFGFDHTIINKPGLRDFRITSITGKGNNTRPGVVMVSYDANGNGEADDEWYEIAGSEYNHVQTERGIDITYYRQTEDLDNFEPSDDYMKWTMSNGESGYLKKRMLSNCHPYYPIWYKGEKEDQVTFKNLTKLRSTIVMNGMFPDQSSDANYKPFEYGYACNVANSNEIGTSIDIAWAVDAEGKYVNLSGIDFVKVYTGTFKERGLMYWEASTDISNAYDLHMERKEYATVPQQK